MNQLPKKIVEHIVQLALAGTTQNAIARQLEISPNTVARYYPTDQAKCACGQDAGHQGWCFKRYAESPARQAVFGGKPRLRDPIKEDDAATRLTCVRCGSEHTGLYIRCGPRVRVIITAPEVPKYGRFAALCRVCQRELAFKGSMAQLLVHDIKRYGRHIAWGNGHRSTLWRGLNGTTESTKRPGSKEAGSPTQAGERSQKRRIPDRRKGGAKCDPHI